jgi:uncharacterized protein YlxP (DUF503 family)
MIIGVCEIELYLSGVSSLKEKRGIIKSLVVRVHQKFNVAASEVKHQDLWQSSVVGIVTVTNSSRHANQVMDHVLSWIEDNYPQAMIVKHTTEII